MVSTSWFIGLFLLWHSSAETVNDMTTIDRACSVFCHGPILTAVQTVDPPIYNDSKTFVDMPLAIEPEEALSMFNPNFSREELIAFLDANFLSVGSDLVVAAPPDWTEEPLFLSRIGNATWRNFALQLNNIWPDLYREVSPNVFEQPQRYSLLRRRNGVVLPGGRFRETYYWCAC
jgi:alpha,alpha-trehalase